MRKLVPTTLLGIAGLTTLGLLGMQSSAVNADDAIKRDEDSVELVLVADDDDDDTNDDTNSGFTGFSRSTGDHTRSNFTAVSRDRDLSRSDKTRDKTWDGPGGKKRDWSANRTNDRSRNDTRG